MIIYGLVTETSVTDLFAAGFGPGLLITFVLSAYSVWFNWNMPTARFDIGEFRVAFREGMGGDDAGDPARGHLFGLLHGHGGGCRRARILAAGRVLVHKEPSSATSTASCSRPPSSAARLFPLIAVALSLNIILTEHRVPQSLVELMQGYISSPIMFMLLVNILLSIVGCLMTTGEAILVLAPLLAPRRRPTATTRCCSA